MNAPELVDLVYSYFESDVTRHPISDWDDQCLYVLRVDDFPVLKIMGGAEHGDWRFNLYDRLCDIPDLRSKFYSRFNRAHRYALKFGDGTVLYRTGYGLCESLARERVVAHFGDSDLVDVRLCRRVYV